MDLQFHNPTVGKLTFDQMFKEIINFMGDDPGSMYKLIVGTDSHTHDECLFVTAIVIHRLGKGARFFYHKQSKQKINSLRQKIFYETSLSLGMAGQLAERFAENGNADLDVEIHLDVGRNGKTRQLIREIVGMVTGSGFAAKIKPDSFGASKVADKYTK